MIFSLLEGGLRYKEVLTRGFPDAKEITLLREFRQRRSALKGGQDVSYEERGLWTLLHSPSQDPRELI